MKRNFKNKNGITLVSLVVTIIILIILAGVSINAVIGENGIITLARKAKENVELGQIEEQTKLNELYMQIEREEGETGDITYDIIESLTKGTTAEKEHILKNYTAYSKGVLVTGTMENRGAVNQSLDCGQSYTIPAGYHNGSGVVIANSLESQTVGDATAEDIANGKTAWVNGNQLTGTAYNSWDELWINKVSVLGGWTLSQNGTKTITITRKYSGIGILVRDSRTTNGSYPYTGCELKINNGNTPYTCNYISPINEGLPAFGFISISLDVGDELWVRQRQGGGGPLVVLGFD